MSSTKFNFIRSWLENIFYPLPCFPVVKIFLLSVRRDPIKFLIFFLAVFALSPYFKQPVLKVLICVYILVHPLKQ
jgi:hypothetical protein